jgi:hypothetical protein
MHTRSDVTPLARPGTNPRPNGTNQQKEHLPTPPEGIVQRPLWPTNTKSIRAYTTPPKVITCPAPRGSPRPQTKPLTPISGTNKHKKHPHTPHHPKVIVQRPLWPIKMRCNPRCDPAHPLDGARPPNQTLSPSITLPMCPNLAARGEHRRPLLPCTTPPAAAI